MKESQSRSDCVMRKSFQADSSHSVKKVNRNTFLKEMRIYLLALVVQLYSENNTLGINKSI